MMRIYVGVTLPALDDYFSAIDAGTATLSGTNAAGTAGGLGVSSAGSDLFWLIYSLFPFRFLTIVWVLTLVVGLDFFTKQTTFRLAWNRLTGGFMLFLSKPGFAARPGLDATLENGGSPQFEARGNARPTSVLQFDPQL